LGNVGRGSRNVVRERRVEKLGEGTEKNYKHTPPAKSKMSNRERFAPSSFLGTYVPIGLEVFGFVVEGSVMTHGVGVGDDQGTGVID
jgi:hypothetical protein